MTPRRSLRGLLAPLRWLLRVAIALLLLFEEWGWEPLQRALARFGRLPLLHRLEAAVGRAPPRLAVLLFLVPTALLLPLKLLALTLVARGKPLLAVGLLLAAKLLGTAVVARLYALTRPALMQLTWFAALHARWMAWKEPLLAQVRASRPWRMARKMRQQWRQAWKRWRER